MLILFKFLLNKFYKNFYLIKMRHSRKRRQKSKNRKHRGNRSKKRFSRKKQYRAFSSDESRKATLERLRGHLLAAADADPDLKEYLQRAHACGGEYTPGLRGLTNLCNYRDYKPWPAHETLLAAAAFVEEEARRRAIEEEARRRAIEEEARRRAIEEEARRRAIEEEARRRTFLSQSARDQSSLLPPMFIKDKLLELDRRGGLRKLIKELRPGTRLPYNKNLLTRQVYGILKEMGYDFSQLDHLIASRPA